MTLSQTRPTRPSGLAALPLRMLLTAGICAGLAAPAAAQDAELEVTFISVDGAEIGTAQLTGTRVGLLVELDLQGLQPETWHGFHIHENGECDAEGGFESAGGHFTATEDTEHGFHSQGGPHSGDMPNQYAAIDGTLKAEVFNPYAFFGGDNDNVTGRALILHGGADDYESQPSGDAGDRVACAVIE